LPTPRTTREPTRWVGLSASARRTERRTLLLDAALELLGTEGWPGTTVRAVCHHARLNPRYFYESFADLDELVVAVYDRLIADLGARVMAAVAAAGDDPGDQTRAALRSIIDFVDEDRRRGRVLYVEALGNEALNRRRIETAHLLVTTVEEHAAATQGALPEGEPIGRIGAALLVGGAGELIVAWLEGRIDVHRDQLVEDAAELLLAMGEAAARLATRRARAN
jgi:AcrR family transcriptional regulator